MVSTALQNVIMNELLKRQKCKELESHVKTKKEKQQQQGGRS